MHKDCEHAAATKAQDLYCQACGAIRNSADRPWRELSAAERRLHDAMGNAGTALVSLGKEVTPEELDELMPIKKNFNWYIEGDDHSYSLTLTRRS